MNKLFGVKHKIELGTKLSFQRQELEFITNYNFLLKTNLQIIEIQNRIEWCLILEEKTSLGIFCQNKLKKSKKLLISAKNVKIDRYDSVYFYKLCL